MYGLYLYYVVIPAEAGLNSIGLNLNSERLARRADYMDVFCNPAALFLVANCMYTQELFAAEAAPTTEQWRVARFEWRGKTKTLGACLGQGLGLSG